MMFGNVAPAPFSFTCAVAGAASVRAAASASSGNFSIRDASSWLERELGLEQGLGANRILRHQRRPLEVDVVPVAEQPPVGGELIGHAADEPSLLVGRVSRLGMLEIHARDDGRLGLGELVDAECAVDVPIADRGRRGSGTERPVPSRRCLAGEGELLRRSEEHTSELQSLAYLVCRLLLEKKKKKKINKNL